MTTWTDSIKQFLNNF